MSDYILKKGSEGRMSISIMTEKMIGWAERKADSTDWRLSELFRLGAAQTSI